MLRMIATEKQRYDDALGRTDFAKSALVLLKANAPHERAEVGKVIGASERVQSLFQKSTVAGATVSGSGLTSGAETMLSAWMDALANVSAAERIFAGGNRQPTAKRALTEASARCAAPPSWCYDGNA